MARPRKATNILNATGAFEKNPNRARSNEPVAGGVPEKPKYLKGAAAKIWEQYAPLCVAIGTLAAVDAREFATWCWLEAEFEKDPARMTAAMITQKRAYGERFGMSASARAKLGNGDNGDQKEDPADKYFKPGDTGSGKGLLQ